MSKNTGASILGTKVINAVVEPPPSKNLKDPVEMTFEKTTVSGYVISLQSFLKKHQNRANLDSPWMCKETLRNMNVVAVVREEQICSKLINFAVRVAIRCLKSLLNIPQFLSSWHVQEWFEFIKYYAFLLISFLSLLRLAKHFLQPVHSF